MTREGCNPAKTPQAAEAEGLQPGGAATRPNPIGDLEQRARESFGFDPEFAAELRIRHAVIAAADRGETTATVKIADAQLLFEHYAAQAPRPLPGREEWVTISAERALYVDRGKTVLLVDRLPSPIHLLLKNPACSDRAYLPSAVTGEFPLPLADREDASAALSLPKADHVTETVKSEHVATDMLADQLEEMREACAKVADSFPGYMQPRDVAAAIRALPLPTREATTGEER
jgi:hypothetical protein